jgi:hypothetical protein
MPLERMQYATFATAIILVMYVRTGFAQVAALSCSSGNVRYAGSTLPLVMGGVMASCKQGCSSRDDQW